MCASRPQLILACRDLRGPASHLQSAPLFLAASLLTGLPTVPCNPTATLKEAIGGRSVDSAEEQSQALGACTRQSLTGTVPHAGPRAFAATPGVALRQQAASVRVAPCLASNIQFIKGVDEPVVPEVKLTRSRDGGSGTATFMFMNPTVFEADSSLGDITGMYLVDEEGELTTADVNAKFVNGKPNSIECKYVMRSTLEWDRFMRFMERYAEDNALGFKGVRLPHPFRVPQCVNHSVHTCAQRFSGRLPRCCCDWGAHSIQARVSRLHIGPPCRCQPVVQPLLQPQTQNLMIYRDIGCPSCWRCACRSKEYETNTHLSTQPG